MTVSDRSPVPDAFRVLRDAAAHLVQGWAAPSRQLDQVRTEMLRTLETNPACAWRDGGPVHFTAGLVLLDETLEHVALTLHAKAKRWFQFGGHLEAGDVDVAAAAAREGREESGIGDFRMIPDLVHVDAHDLPAAFGRCRRHLDLRFAAVTSSRTLAVSDESDAVRWWPLDALPPRTEDTLCEGIHLAREALRGQ